MVDVVDGCGHVVLSAHALDCSIMLIWWMWKSFSFLIMELPILMDSTTITLQNLRCGADVAFLFYLTLLAKQTIPLPLLSTHVSASFPSHPPHLPPSYPFPHVSLHHLTPSDIFTRPVQR